MQRQYKMIIRSHMGPIDLYLLSKYEGQVEDTTVKQAKSVDACSSYGLLCGVERSELSSEEKASQNNSSKTVNLVFPEAYGIQKLIPTVSEADDDYGFLSDPEVSITVLWDT
ncbi:PREDICTED: transcription factor E2FA [Theobroma cacao]|uniref:Transcription factor E2FA n=1 Tax=Theobroma cacao TaxID=3641 RepID=A0AB32WPA5_THECC|nr:PREDICTED: transcription factor E2FA [Theobroma cacao]